VRLLFIGGSGIISSACSRLAAERDIDLFVLNRGRTQDRPLPAVVTVHVPSDVIAAADPEWGAGLLGDKSHSLVFDNAKLRSVVPGYRAVIPFEQGAREIVAWYDEEPARQRIDAGVDAVSDKLAQAFRPGL
jgi:hypothetical protein